MAVHHHRPSNAPIPLLAAALRPSLASLPRFPPSPPSAILQVEALQPLSEFQGLCLPPLVLEGRGA